VWSFDLFMDLLNSFPEKNGVFRACVFVEKGKKKFWLGPGVPPPPHHSHINLLNGKGFSFALAIFWSDPRMRRPMTHDYFV